MPRFGLVGPSYESQSPNLDAQKTVNWYPEVDESGAGNSPIALLPTPGTKLFCLMELIVEALAQAASQSSGPCAPTEVAWNNPSNVTLNTPGTYASVALNTGSPSTPALNTSQTITFTSGSGNTLLYHIHSGSGIPGPVVAIWPLNTQAGPSPTPGDSGWVTSVTDTVDSNPWTILQDHTSWNISFGSTDPGKLVNFQFIAKVFPAGLPANWDATITFNLPEIDVATDVAFVRTSFFTGVTGIDTFAFHKISPTTTPANSGANVTTSVLDLLISVANLVNVGHIIPAGFGEWFNSMATPGLGYTYSNTTQPAGVYNPIWSYGGSSVPSPTQETVLATLALIAQTAGGEPCSESLIADNFGLAIPGGASIKGVAVEIGGHQTDLTSDVKLFVQLKPSGGPISPITLTAQLPASDGFITVGDNTQLWGMALTTAMLNNAAFSAVITAEAHGGETVTFDLYAVKLKVWYV